MKKITKILLIPLIIVVVFTSLMGVASATYVKGVTEAYVTLAPDASSAIHEAVSDGEKMGRIISPAMAPTIQVGAIVYYKPVAYDTLAVGDLIIAKPGFTEQGVNMIARRITGITSAGLSTKGDGNAQTDTWTTTPDMVLGKIADIKNP